MGNNGVQYARSYSASGLKAHARSFEALRSDAFFIQYANNVTPSMLEDAIQRMSEIASYLFREQNMEISVHGNKNKFKNIRQKIEELLSKIKEENSLYSQKVIQ